MPYRIIDRVIDRIIIALLAAAGLAAVPATAQDGAAGAGPDAVQTIETHAVRDPAMMPYAEAYDMLTRVGKVGNGRIAIVIRVLAKKSMQPIPDLEVALQGANTFTRLPVADDGTVAVPLDANYLADKADFVTNKKKGAIQPHMILLPLLPAEHPTYADLGASLDGARRAIGELMPWYLRVFFGRVHDVRLCYPEAGREVRLGAGASRVAAEETRNALNGKTVYCASFASSEVEGAPQTVIDAPPGYVAMFR